jgi:hypothetical protein|tara:strand:- start:2141 stop:3589 length:1449 start_codon:yes stop_codon:yes gene_type:complete
MKFILLSDLGTKPTRAGQLQNNSRASGALHIVQVANNLGVEATNIDYWRCWSTSLIRDSIIEWFGDDEEPWIGLSGSIDGSSTKEFKTLVHLIKREVPQLKVMLGGYRVPTGESSWVDMAFIGRSGNIFTRWLQKEDISEYVFANNPLTYKNPHGEILETPVAPILKEEDFWHEGETHTIEIALGCKFNCSFCGYDFRNNKNPVLIDEEKLFNSIKSAHDKFGITNFVLADDTINEVDTKLELLAKVNDQLDFEPNYMAFTRVDVLGAKPHQIELIQKARINSMFFGIESLTPEVTKIIRKGGKPERMLQSLRMVKNEYPEAFTFGNLIIGLTGDNADSIWKNCEKIVEEQLLTSGGCNPLRLYSNLENPDVESDFDKNPEKFGYEIIGSDKEWEELGYSSQIWKNDWTDSDGADDLSSKIDVYLGDNLESKFTSHEVFGLQTLIPGEKWGWYNDHYNLANQQRNFIVKRYIKNKSKWLQGR